MQSIPNRLSSATQTIFQACLDQPKTAIALTTLFFAKVVEATTGETAQAGPLDGVIDWISQDTGIKVGAFGVLAISAFVIWRLKKGSGEQTPQKLGTEAAGTHKKLTERRGGSEGSKGLPRPEQEGDGDNPSTVVKRTAAVTKKTGAGNKAEPKIARVVDFEVPPTPGKVDFDPLAMRGATEKILRDTFTWPRQNGLLCYLLAARMMQENKFAAAKKEANKGYIFVKSSKGDEDIRTQLLIQINMCDYEGAPKKQARSNHAAPKKEEEVIPETPGVVKLTPDQMVDSAVEALTPLFIKYDQYAQLCLLVAVDLMLANNKYEEAKAIAKKGYYLRTWADDNVRISTKMEKCGKAPKMLKGTEIGKQFEDLMAKCNDLIKIQKQAAAKAKKPLPQPKGGGEKAEQGATGAPNKGPAETEDKPPPPPPRSDDEDLDAAVDQIKQEGLIYPVEEEGANSNAVDEDKPPKAPPFPAPTGEGKVVQARAPAEKKAAPKLFTGADLFTQPKKIPEPVPPTPSKLPPPNVIPVPLVQGKPPQNLPPPPNTLPKGQSAVAPARSNAPRVEDDAEAPPEEEPKTPPALAKIRDADANAEQRRGVFAALTERKPRQDGEETKTDGLKHVNTPPTVAREKKKDAAKTAGYNVDMAKRRQAVALSPKKPGEDDDDSWSE